MVQNGNQTNRQEAEGNLSERPPGYYVPETWTPAGYTLHKVPDQKGYELRDRFEYVDRDGQTFIVPESRRLGTDLASIPSFASWLVPKDGRHTQAALLHDAMIVSAGQIQDYIGPPVDDEKADRIFRDGMQISGAPFVRRWMMWTAVAMRSLWISRGPWTKLRLVLSVPIFVVLGLLGFPDVLDFPQYIPFKAVLWISGILAPLGVGVLLWKRLRFNVLVVLLPAAMFLALVVVAIGVLPDQVPSRSPSVLPDVHKDGDSWHWAGWSWQRSENDDPLWIQGGVFLGMLLGGAVGNMLFFIPRPRFGFLLALLLGVLAFPLYFVVVATVTYWLIEGIGIAIRWVRSGNAVFNHV